MPPISQEVAVAFLREREAVCKFLKARARDAEDNGLLIAASALMAAARQIDLGEHLRTDKE